MPRVLGRVVCHLLMCVWLGGFTFYGGVVVPILHEELDGMTTGLISQRVTDSLNLIGLATCLFWGVDLAIDPWRRGNRLRGVSVVLLVLSAALLMVLAWLHDRMDRMLEEGPTRGFYPLHRVYLRASTAQWIANIGLISLEAVRWSSPAPRSGEGRGEATA